jgi:three-Cys-motif partner protein
MKKDNADCVGCKCGGEKLPHEQCSVPDPSDGLPVMCVGNWAEMKMDCLRYYVGICSGVRGKFTTGRGGATYIDLFAGPGRTRTRGSDSVQDGGALEAVRCATSTSTVFNEVFVGDIVPEFVDATGRRLSGRPDAR